MDTLQAELVRVNREIESIDEQPPTLDYLVEYMQVTKRYGELKARRKELEGLIQAK